MRQAGVLAAAGIIAIEKMVERLADDHTNARFLAEELNKLDGLKIDLDTVQTNMIYCDISQLKVQVTTFLEILKDKGILVSPVPQAG